jgi:hypothetical protein
MTSPRWSSNTRPLKENCSYLGLSVFICGPKKRIGSQTPDKRKSLAAVRDPLICQAQQYVAAPAHLNGDFAQGGTSEAKPGRLAVDRAAQLANLLRCAFPEIL